MWYFIGTPPLMLQLLSHRSNESQTTVCSLVTGDGRDPRDHYLPLYEALRVLQELRPAVTVDLQGITLRK